MTANKFVIEKFCGSDIGGCCRNCALKVSARVSNFSLMNQLNLAHKDLSLFIAQAK